MALWTTTKRIARYGLIGFIRNGFVSLAAIVIMTITLFVSGVLLISGAALQATLEQLTSKVDVNVYFTTTATEAQVLAIQRELEPLPEVAQVTYTSREQALAEFRERHKTDASTIRALEQLSDNPLGASLAIRAKETSQYESIAQFLAAKQQTPDGAIISKVNFYQNRTAIERLTSIIQTARTISAVVALFLAGASVLIAFNTIRLAIYTARDEIGVMNLVGASHWYVRGPFVIAGILYGVISGIIVLAVLYPLTAWIGPASERFFGTFNVFDYYTGNFAFLFLAIMGTGIILGAISSFLAVRRYLHT
ncbi:MAG TPA: permease-like cell division protein FtsX [Candidatus Paceibacterota bacterium]|nr:permease-like cell division protein FtsX [Candidatus Paceibacterota bacterium]